MRMRSQEFVQEEKMRVVRLDLRPETNVDKIKANRRKVRFLEELALLIHPDSLVSETQQEILKQYISLFCEADTDPTQRARDLLLLASNLNAWK